MLVYTKGLPVAKEFGSTGSGIGGLVRGDRPIQCTGDKIIMSLILNPYRTELLTWCR